MGERVNIIIRAKDLASNVFGRVQRRLRKLGISARGIGRAFVAATVSLAGLTLGLRKLFTIGAGALETQSKFNTVLQEQAAAMDAVIARYARLAGLTRTEAREIVATTAAIAQGLGMSTAASARFAEAILRLAGDIASFNNLPTADVARAIQAAVTGEREQLKRLGIVIREVDVQQRALAMTGKRTTKELTDQEKAAATLRLVHEKATTAVGDLARTQDSAANRARQVRARFREIAETISTGLIPALENVLPVLDRIASKAETMATKVSGFFTTLSDMVGLTNPFARAEVATFAGLDRSGLERRRTDLKSEIASLDTKALQVKTLQNIAARDRTDPQRSFLRANRNAEEEAEGLRQALEVLESRLESMEKQTDDTTAAVDRALKTRPVTTGFESEVKRRLNIQAAGPKVQTAAVPELRTLDPTSNRTLFRRVEKHFHDITDESDAMASVVASNVEHMAQAAIVGSANMEQAVVSSFARILQSVRGLSPLQGALFGIAGALVGSIIGKSRSQPVRIERFEPQAERQLEQRMTGPSEISVTILNARGEPIDSVDYNLREGTRLDAIARFPGIPHGGIG